MKRQECTNCGNDITKEQEKGAKPKIKKNQTVETTPDLEQCELIILVKKPRIWQGTSREGRHEPRTLEICPKLTSATERAQNGALVVHVSRHTDDVFFTAPRQLVLHSIVQVSSRTF